MNNELVNTLLTNLVNTVLTNSLFIYRRKYVCVAFPTDSFGKIFECQNSASTGNRIQKRGILVAFSAYSFEKQRGKTKVSTHYLTNSQYPQAIACRKEVFSKSTQRWK